jgi:hypothetical protein
VKKKEIEIMKLQLKALSIALGAATLMCGSAWGDSSIITGSSPNLTATSNVKLALKIPRIIALRIGDADTVNTITITQGTGSSGDWGVNTSDPTVASLFGATSAINDANSNNTTAGKNLKMWAWTNITGGGTITCVFTPGGSTIASTDLQAVSIGSGGVGHPAGSDLGAQCGTPSVTFTPVGTIKTDTWEYNFIGTPSSYIAGTYTSSVKYSAVAL